MGVYPVKNLKEIRKTKYKSAKDMAHKCGFSLRTLQRAESGKLKVSLFTIEKIAMALDIEKEEIIDQRTHLKEKSHDSTTHKKRIYLFRSI